MNDILCVEPTTGLDSAAATKLMQCLITVAKELDIAVLMTIHQPGKTIEALMQNLYLISAGRMVYFGPAASAADYFSSRGYNCPPRENYTDFYLRIMVKPPSDTSSWTAEYVNSDMCEGMAKPNAAISPVPRDIISPPIPSPISRITTTVNFLLVYYLRDPGYFLYRGLYCVATGLYFGSLFFDLNPEIGDIGLFNGAIFYLFWGLFFASFVSIHQAVRDSEELRFHNLNGITTPFIAGLSSFVVSMIYNFGCSVIFCSIFVSMTNISHSFEAYIYCVLITWMHLLFMDSCVLIFAAIVKNAAIITVLCLLVLGNLLSLSGFFKSVADSPLLAQILSYGIPSRVSLCIFYYSLYEKAPLTIICFVI